MALRTGRSVQLGPAAVTRRVAHAGRAPAQVPQVAAVLGRRHAVAEMRVSLLAAAFAELLRHGLAFVADLQRRLVGGGQRGRSGTDMGRAGRGRQVMQHGVDGRGMRFGRGSDRGSQGHGDLQSYGLRPCFGGLQVPKGQSEYNDCTQAVPSE